MKTPEFFFDGLDRAEEVLAEAAASGEGAYVRLLHYITDTNAPQVGRKTWSPVDLAHFLRDDDEDDDSSFVAEPDDGDAGDPKMMAAALCRWAREAVGLHCGGDTSTTEWTFKLDFRSPKGTKCIAAPRFRVRRAKAAPDGVSSLAPTIPLDNTPTGNVAERGGSAIPLSGASLSGAIATFNEIERAWSGHIAGVSRSLALLQAGYTHQMRLSLALGQDAREGAAVANQTLTDQVRRQAAQISQRDAMIAKLTDELLGFRIDLLGLGLEHGSNADTSKERLALMERGFATVQEVGKLYMAGKLDVEPELVNLLMVVRTNPALLACLKNPKVVKALEHPDVQATVIDALMTVAATIPDEPPPPPPPTDKKE